MRNSSSSTVYRHIRKGYLSIAPIDLARAVKFKERRKSKLPSIPKEAKKGRSYEDFLNYLALKQLNSWLEVPNVTTPSKLIPTVELQQDPDTGEVTVTPKKPDGTLYPENTKVEIPGKDKEHPITITIGKDGKGKVPNNELPTNSRKKKMLIFKTQDFTDHQLCTTLVAKLTLNFIQFFFDNLRNTFWLSKNIC